VVSYARRQAHEVGITLNRAIGNAADFRPSSSAGAHDEHWLFPLIRQAEQNSRRQVLSNFCMQSIVSQFLSMCKILETMIDIRPLVFHGYEILHRCPGCWHVSYPDKLRTVNMPGICSYVLTSTQESVQLPLRYQSIHHQRMLFVNLDMDQLP